jgi:hypothetical protein
MNSTFISASEVNIMAYDMGYPYPVNNISLNPLYNESYHFNLKTQPE